MAEVFLTAWRRITDIPDEPLPWLLVVARHSIANQDRGSRRRLQLERRLAAERPAFAAAPTVHVLDPELAAALRQLSDDDRELLCLIAWERLTREEAARALNCRPSALRLRLHRARRRLARELEAQKAERPRLSADVPVSGPGTEGS